MSARFHRYLSGICERSRLWPPIVAVNVIRITAARSRREGGSLLSMHAFWHSRPASPPWPETDTVRRRNAGCRVELEPDSDAKRYALPPRERGVDRDARAKTDP